MTASFQEGTELPAFLAAAHRAAQGKRHQSDVSVFLMDAERRCVRLQQALRLPVDHPEAYRPGPVHTFSIRDPKQRLITVSSFADRVVQHVLCAMLVPALERYAIEDSYACREGKGQHRAVRRAQHFCRGAPWAFKGDVSAYFASIPHDRLLLLLARRVEDPVLHAWIVRIVRCGGQDGRGLPIGALVSQHLANLYLGALDHLVKDDLGVRRYLRYMDDIVAFGEREAMRALRMEVDGYLSARLGLRLNLRASRVLPVRDGVPFLGFRVYPRALRVRQERWRRFGRAQAVLERAMALGRLDEEEAAMRARSRFAHLAAAGAQGVCRVYVSRLARGEAGVGRERFESRQPGGLVRQRPAEPAGREPRQELAGQSRQEPWFSSCEFSTPRGEGTEGSGLRSGSLCPGADQAGVRCPDGLSAGTESPVPGGGLRGVVTGPFLSS